MAVIPVADRLDIQDLVARYAYRCDTKDYDRVGELFAEHGSWDETAIGQPYCEGRTAIHGYFSGMGAAKLVDYIIHTHSNHQIIDFAGDSASGTVHLHVEGCVFGNPIRILGYYADDYVRTGDTWLIKSRTLIEFGPSTGFKIDGK